MIYQVKDNKKIPLGTQFDNSWNIEYDRNLSSQLSGKTEWTATEDCWFQYTGLWVRNNGNEDIDKARDLKISVNGVEVQTRDSSGTGTTAITVLLFSASVLLKKGDVITFKNSLGSPFDPSTIKVFPIHRILSKDEGPKVFSLAKPSEKDLKLRLTFKNRFLPVFVSYMRDTTGYQSSKPDPFVIFTSGGAVKTIPNDVQSSFVKETDYIFTLTIPKSSTYPDTQNYVTVTEVQPGTLINAELVEA